MIIKFTLYNYKKKHCLLNYDNNINKSIKFIIHSISYGHQYFFYQICINLGINLHVMIVNRFQRFYKKNVFIPSGFGINAKN